MSLPTTFAKLSLPTVAALMFLTSGTDLVVAVCRWGLVGTFPALNQRRTEGFIDWLEENGESLAYHPGAALFGVNLIVHKSNPRLAADLEQVVRRKGPLVITSLGAVKDVVEAVLFYAGLGFHDVIGRRHVEKAAEAGGRWDHRRVHGRRRSCGDAESLCDPPGNPVVFGGALLLSVAISTGHSSLGRA